MNPLFITPNRKIVLISLSVLLLGLLIFGGFRSCGSTWFERQDERDKQIELKDKEIDALKDAAKAKDAQIELLTKQNAQLEAEDKDIRADIQTTHQGRKAITKRYAGKQKEIDSFTSADELRRANCLERAKLGFDCAN